MQVSNNDLNEAHALTGSGCSNSEDASTLPRHRWYPVKEAFSPSVVDKAIADACLKKADIIIDPFCGSGTVTLGGALRNHKTIGLEVNPFLAFVSRAKLQQVKPSTIDKGLRAVEKSAKIGRKSPLECFSTFSEAGGAEKWLFNSEVLTAFEGGWSATAGLYRPVRDVLRLGLIGAATDTCNAKKDGKCLRYRKDWKSLQLGQAEFLEALEGRMKNIAFDVSASRSQSELGTVHLADSRTAIPAKIKGKFRLCVTSPPYLNSFDYTDIYRPELFLGKFVRNMEDLRALRQRTVRSHVQAKWQKPKANAFGTLYDHAISQLNERLDHVWDRNIPLMIQAYFEDIERVLRALYARAADDASVWLIVSTSAYAGVEIPVDLIIAHVASKVGWFLREIGVLRYMRSSGQRWKRWASMGPKPRLRESIVILDANRPRVAVTRTG